MLGFYLTSHPLAEHAKKLMAYCTHTTVEAATLKHRDKVMIGGMIASIKHSHTKNPKPGAPSHYAMFDLEDTEGMMRSICWPEQFAQFGHLIQPDAICVLSGAIDKRPGSEEANFIVDEVIPIADLEARYTRGIRVRLIEETHGAKKLEMLYEILRGYRGNVPFELLLALTDGRKISCRCDTFRVANNPEMRNRVEELLGAGEFPVNHRPARWREREGTGVGNSSHAAGTSLLHAINRPNLGTDGDIFLPQTLQQYRDVVPERSRKANLHAANLRARTLPSGRLSEIGSPTLKRSSPCGMSPGSVSKPTRSIRKVSSTMNSCLAILLARSRLQPIHYLEARNSPEVRLVVRHKNRVQRQGVRGDQRVFRIDRLTDSFQFIANQPIMSRALDRIIVKQLERREHLANAFHFDVVSTA